MINSEYIERTRSLTKFLSKVFEGNVACVANIFQAQGTQDTPVLMAALTGVKEQIEKWIEDLNEIYEEE